MARVGAPPTKQVVGRQSCGFRQRPRAVRSVRQEEGVPPGGLRAAQDSLLAGRGKVNLQLAQGPGLACKHMAQHLQL